MRGRAFEIAAVAIVSGIVLLGLYSIQTSAQQAATPRTLDGKSPITYFIAAGSERTGFHPGDRQLALWALEAWQRSAAKGLRIEASTESDALVRLYWAEASDGQYGEMRPLMVGARRGAAVFIRPDMESLGEDVAESARTDELLRDSIVYLTCLHELGHALGLTHTSDFRDIMYFFGFGGDIVEYFDRYRSQLRSRGDIAAVSGLSDLDVARVRAMYPAP